MGNERLTRLPVWEMVFGSMPDSLAAIATRKVKWDKRYQAKYGITTRAAEDLPPAVLAQLDKLSRRIYRALGLSGYARMDFRVTADGHATCSRPMPIQISKLRKTSRNRRGPRATVRRAAREADGAGPVVPGGVARNLWLEQLCDRAGVHAVRRMRQPDQAAEAELAQLWSGIRAATSTSSR